MEEDDLITGQAHNPLTNLLIATSGHEAAQHDWSSLTVYVLDMHNPNTDIEFDPAKEKSNLRKHKVSFAQAEEALRDPMSITIDDADTKDEQRFSTLGADTTGRILIVIHTPRGDRTRLISARKASKGEAELYHEKGI